MKALFTLLLLIIACLQVQAQTVRSKPLYYSWIYLNNQKEPLKGVIVAAKDSSLLFINSTLLINNKNSSNINPQEVPVSTISKVKYRKRSAVRKGLLFGALGGAAAGGIIGYASGDDECDGTGGWFDCMFMYTAEEKAGTGALLGIFPGMGLGALIGAARKTIYINGDQKVYSLSRSEFEAYSLNRQ